VLQRTTRLGGRGYSIAVWVSGLMTIVEMLATWALFQNQLSATAWGQVTAAFMWGMAAIGGAYQLPNAAERLPGERRWDGRGPGRGTAPEMED